MKVVEKDFSGFTILFFFFFSSEVSWGVWKPCYILASSSKEQVAWHGSHLCHHGGSVDGVLTGTKGPRVCLTNAVL